MISLLLAIIYIAFISLGLPDSLLGSGWPVMYKEFSAPLSYAGIISMIISASTIVSSLCSDKWTRKLGTGLVTALSTLLTAVALFGFSVSNSFVLLCLLSVPYGLGAGAIDAAMNNYVAIHYNSRHMSWLHCFWGLGACISPYIMSYALSTEHGWRGGYSIVSILQIVITLFLFFTLPLWKKVNSNETVVEKATTALGLIDVFHIKGVILLFIAFLCYCSFEWTAGLWACSYLAEYRSLNNETAAAFGSFIFVGITIGRFLCGFISDKIGDKNMIRTGLVTICIGLLFVILPVNSPILALAGLMITGVGAAPVYPSIIHSVPTLFGVENSQSIIGILMAFAYVGSTFAPPLFGWIADFISIGFYPFYLLVFVLLTFVLIEKLNKLLRR